MAQVEARDPQRPHDALPLARQHLRLFPYDDTDAVFVFINNSRGKKQVPWSHYAEIASGLSDGRNVLTVEATEVDDTTTVGPRQALIVEFKRK